MPSMTREYKYETTLTHSFWMEMKQIVDRVSYDPLVRVIVLSSALEKFFTAGLDGAGDTLFLADTQSSRPRLAAMVPSSTRLERLFSCTSTLL